MIFGNKIQHPSVLGNSIDYESKGCSPPFLNSDTNPVFGNSMDHSLNKTHVLVVTGMGSTLFQCQTILLVSEDRQIKAV